MWADGPAILWRWKFTLSGKQAHIKMEDEPLVQQGVETETSKKSGAFERLCPCRNG